MLHDVVGDVYVVLRVYVPVYLAAGVCRSWLSWCCVQHILPICSFVCAGDCVPSS